MLTIAQRVVSQGAAREGKVATDIGPNDARALLESWLRSVGLQERGRALLDHMQSDGFSHAGLYRRARRVHERKLRVAVRNGAAAVAGGEIPAAIADLFDALVPAVPYAPTAAFLGAEKAKLAARSGERPRVAVVVDGIDAMHGVTHTIEQIRERDVPGFEVEVVGTDAGVDRRLPAAATLEVPFYDGLRLGVPALPELFETLAEGRYDAVSPSPAADRSLLELGADGGRIRRWERGVDVERFDPAKAEPDAFPGELKILYAGRLSREKGVDLLAESFLRARRAEPVVAVSEGGPTSLVENRHTGILCRPDVDHLAGAILQLAASPSLRHRLGTAGRRAAESRSWERALEQLAAGYRRGLAGATSIEQTALQAA